MPNDVTFSDESVRSVATEEELLDFANKIRAAGGANVLEALLPSTPQDPHACLIANALNFGCRVDGLNSDQWHMELPGSFDFAKAKAIADSVECKVAYVASRYDEEKAFWRSVYEALDAPPASDAEDWAEDYDGFVILLPEHIGNAAAAFDDGSAFVDFNDGREF